jgi:ferredoxin hydrogenase
MSHKYHQQSADVKVPIKEDNPAVVFCKELCIECGACRHSCETDASANNNSREPVCVYCGQCTTVCPSAAITERYNYIDVKKAISDPDKIVVFNIAPAVKVSLGEEFGMSGGSFAEGKAVAALRELGADYVLDVCFSADLIVLEETAEFIERFGSGSEPHETGTGTGSGLLPLFTSCCSSWVQYAEAFFPEILPYVSKAKSPIAMQGNTVKTYFAKKHNINPEKIVNVAVAPCTAKKHEIRRSGAHGTDYVITARELAKWIKEEEAKINWDQLRESAYDKLMGTASGAGVIFGNTGGVTEAVARTVYYQMTGEIPGDDYLKFHAARGMSGIKTATVNIAGKPVNIAVVHGLDNAKEIIENIIADKNAYDFVEVMACRGGCIGGGGQPRTAVPTNDALRRSRTEPLYKKDCGLKLRSSYQNPEIKELEAEAEHI